MAVVIQNSEQQDNFQLPVPFVAKWINFDYCCCCCCYFFPFVCMFVPFAVASLNMFSSHSRALLPILFVSCAIDTVNAFLPLAKSAEYFFSCSLNWFVPAINWHTFENTHSLQRMTTKCKHILNSKRCNWISIVNVNEQRCTNKKVDARAQKGKCASSYFHWTFNKY